MACSDVQTIQAGNGTKTQFSFDFPYIFKSEIHVYFWNAVTKEYDEKLTTDATYPWQITDANPTIVEFTGTAPPSPATPVDPGEPTVDNVKIRRITQVDDIRALFNPGSAIRSDDLNKNFEQLRYAIQEANCQGIPDDVDAYLKEYYWDRFDNTLYSADTWRSDDATIATTAALDQRFQDEVSETFTKSELAAASNQMPDNDTAVPTTGALNDYINEVITNDIAGSDGVSITDDGDGTITVGLTDNSVDFDKIKDADQIKLADQVADPDVVGTDNNIFTAQAATRRFNNYYQNDVPPVTDGIGIGQVWVDPNDDLTLSVWSGSNWIGVTSGGTFTNQPKVIYVDATSGDDTNDGHRISRPKKTIEAALNDINSDSVYGDGSIISVAPGIYAETLPLDIQKNDVGIIGQSLRTCIIHPKIPVSDQPSYGVNTPHSQELQTMFRVNSGSYFANLTLMGLKASGTRGDTGSLYTDSTYGLPPNQGWNFAFYPNAIIKKSPYIQNVTNFSDSQINNVNFTPHTPGEGAAGDLDSAPTGGGILIDGSVPDTSSPLRSMVCDSYTHTALDGPGIFVTNNGYCQATSSYAFFNHAHITCVNGGQANLAASTTDFGRFGLIADGKSSTAIFTSNVDGAASSGDTTFNINAPTAGSGWFGDATRPQDNMLVTVNSITYPVISATTYTDSEGGAGWTVTISRPDPNDTATNLGLNGAVSDDAAVSFFLRSMVASSGHTMEYVGSGTDYTALPENGGVPIDGNQIIERNDGKVWSATTDHKGTFKLGDFFTVDQQSKSITVDPGSFQVDLGTLNVNASGNAVFGANLDMGSNQITSSSGDLRLSATGDINVQTRKITNVVDPTAAQDAATKNYVDNNFIGSVVDDLSPQLGGNLDVNGNEIISTSNGDITITPDGSGVTIVSSGNVEIKDKIKLYGSSSALNAQISSTGDGTLVLTADGDWNGFNREIQFKQANSDAMRIDSSGRLLVGTTSVSSDQTLVLQGDSGGASRGAKIALSRGEAASAITASESLGRISFTDNSQNAFAEIDGYADGTAGSGDYPGRLVFSTTADGTSSPTPRMTIKNNGNVGVGTSNPSERLHIYHPSDNVNVLIESGDENVYLAFKDNTTTSTAAVYLGATGNDMKFATSAEERMRIDSSGRLLVGTSSARTDFYSGTSGVHAQIEGTSFVTASASITRNSNDSHDGALVFAKSRGTSGGGVALVADDDDLGEISWQGADGVDMVRAARIRAEVDGTPGANDMPGRLVFSTTADGASSPTERMTITAAGFVCPDATSTDNQGNYNSSTVGGFRWVAGSTTTTVRAESYGNSTSTRYHQAFSNPNGIVGTISTSGSATAYNESSDYRLKENVVDITDGIARVKQLQPRRFNFIVDAETTVDGFIAHEAQAVVPEAVTGTHNEVDDDGNAVMQGIDKSKLVPLLTAALQEAIAKIESLEQRLSDAGIA
jgi:hypothetical protein